MVEQRRDDERVAIPRSIRGYAAEGPGFYVWDEDEREARLATEELVACIAARRAARRLQRDERKTRRG